MSVKAQYIGIGEFYAGIPARDLSDEDWRALTPAQQALVKESPLYEIKTPAKKKTGKKDGE